jgi:SET domain-containing protein
MQLGPGRFIDARTKGAITRFINHSCEPNCRIEIWTVEGKRRIGVYAIKDVPAGTELTFDYKWKPSANRKPTR